VQQNIVQLRPQAVIPGVAPVAKSNAGIIRLLHYAGAEVIEREVSSVADRDGTIGLDRLSEIALTLSLRPRLVEKPLGDQLLESSLFAFELQSGDLRIFVPGPHGAPVCLDPGTGLSGEAPSITTVGRSLVFAEVYDTDTASTYRTATAKKPLTWRRLALDGANRTIWSVIGLTLLSSLLGLALPLFTLGVYDQVLAAGSTAILTLLITGLVISIFADLALRLVRSAIISRASSLIDLHTSSELFARMLRSVSSASSRMTRRTGLGRLRDLDVIRNFYLGPTGLAFIEAPFGIVYLIVLAIIGGWLALVPVTVLVLGGAFILLVLTSATNRSRAAFRQADDYGALCDDICSRLNAIKREGESALYLERFSFASARLAQADTLRRRSLVSTQLASTCLISLTVVATLGVGSLLAIDAKVSVGALIASIALVWRIASPLPHLLQARLRWPEVREALTSVNEILGSDIERKPMNRLGDYGSGISGQVSFSSVMMTYHHGQNPAIRNLSLDIKPGHIVAVTGHSGAGKSTLLDLIAGVLEPQFGTVTIDGVNPRQIPSNVFRQSLAYMPRHQCTLPMSIGEFINIGADEAGQDQCAEVCGRLGVLQDIELLPAGFATPMSDLEPTSGLLRAIALARVAASNAKLILLDEPDASSAEARKTLLAEIEQWRGRCTVVMVTHEPEFVAASNRLLVMSQGTLVRDCAPAEIASNKKAVNQ
jgi:ATP-binding cassette, subfamily C, bacterial LapB